MASLPIQENGTLVAGTAHPDPTTQPNLGRSIGFVAGGMGDQIYHLTQLRALASASHDGRIDLGCIHPGPLGALLAHTKWIGKIIDARPLRRYVPGIRGHGAVRALQQTGYDSGFILHRSTSFKLAARMASIKTLVGLSDGWFDQWLLDHPLDLEDGGNRRILWGHRPFVGAIDAYIERIGLTLGTEPTITPGAAEMRSVETLLKPLPKPVTIINMFAIDENRRWPIDSALDVIAKLAARDGGSFILNAGPDALEYHDATLTKWHSRRARQPELGRVQLIDSLRMDPSMQRDIALYHQADRYIGVDSFTANLALNCNLPAIILFTHQRDVLRYREAVHPLVASHAGDIASIRSDEIMQGATALAKKWGARQRENYPLPV